MNNQRDYQYYEANADVVSVEEITSCEQNRRIFRWLRDGDDEELDEFSRCINLSVGNDYRSNHRSNYRSYFSISKCNDLGWLGYFIGRSKCLRKLEIHGRAGLPFSSPEDEDGEQRIINALCDGIARNQSIQDVNLYSLSSDGFAAILRTLGNLTQLEGLTIWSRPANDCVALIGTLLESGVKLKRLTPVFSDDPADTGIVTIARGLRNIGSSLEELDLSSNDIGNDDLLTLAAALSDCPRIKKLDLYENGFSMARSGLAALSRWLQTAGIQLDRLTVSDCDIDDEGLQAMIGGAVNHCKHLCLSYNRRITASGFRLLATALQSERCCVEKIELLDMGFVDDVSIGDDGSEALARGLIGNKTLRNLHLIFELEEDISSITASGWSSFTKALCDTSSVNNTYLSNHTLIEFWNGYIEVLDDLLPQNLARYLELNRRYSQHAARCKILMSHAHLDMAPLLDCDWELKLLPSVINWFERAKTCTALSIGENPILGESDEVFESRILTALYEFVSKYNYYSAAWSYRELEDIDII